MVEFLREYKLSEALEKAIEDGVLTKEELGLLEVEVESGKLPSDDVMKLVQVHFSRRMCDVIERVRLTRRLSPQDDQILSSLYKGLGASAEMGADMLMARVLWTAEQDGYFELPQIALTEVHNVEKESVCFVYPCVWHLVTRKKEYVGYAGLSYEFEVASGLHCRIGNVGPKVTESDAFVSQSSGKLIISNERMLFEGTQKSCCIWLRQITGFAAYEDGLWITKNSGLDDFFTIGPIAAEFACGCLSALLGED